MNSLLEFDELVSAVSGRAVKAENVAPVFSSVVTDSRNVVSGSLFVPLIGEFQDGHKYVPQAVEKGATIVLIAESEYRRNATVYDTAAVSGKAAYIIVQNTLTALQNAAAAYVRKFPSLIRVAITGSSGKTTTKEITASILKEKYRVVCNEGNLNSETGLPLSVFKIRSDTEVGLFEMGMNRRNEIGEIAAVLRPQYAAVTNIGTAHIGILGSRQNIAAEKRKIFSYIEKDGAAVIPAADDFAQFLSEDIQGKVIYYGTDTAYAAKNGVTFISDNGIEGSSFTVDGLPVTLTLPGKYNYSNAMAAIALSRCLGVSAAQIKLGIEKIKALPGRSQTLHMTLPAAAGKTVRQITVFQDCYNANPDSLEKTLELCAAAAAKKIYVLGDMLELGKESAGAHAMAGKLAAESIRNGGGILIFVGQEMKTAAESAEKAGASQIIYFAEHDETAVAKITDIICSKADDTGFILLKGSHGMGLERITERLTEVCNGKL